MNTRSLKATILFIAFLTVGLGLLPGHLIQDADADPCEEARKTCDIYYRMAVRLCNFYGEDTSICDEAWYHYYFRCVNILWICEN